MAGIMLFLYATMLRQGHVLYTPHGESHIITGGGGGVFFENGSMLVLVKSSKAMTKSNRTLIPVLPASDVSVRLVYACRDALALVPAGWYLLAVSLLR